MKTSLNKKVLIVIPYEFYPPKSGGALRCFYATKELSKYFDVTVVTNQDIDKYPQGKLVVFKNIHFYTTNTYKINYGLLRFLLPLKILNYIFFKLFFKRGKSSVNSIFIDFYPALKVALKKINPDVVIFQNLESLFYLSNIVRKYDSIIKIIYEAHNVDYILWRQLYEAVNNIQYKEYSVNAYKVETSLHKYTDCVVCNTNEDETILRDLNNNANDILFTTIPSGVDVDEKKPLLKQERGIIPIILFCGSLNYLPNIEGIRWFYDHVMPLLRNKVKDFKLVIIGNCENLDEFSYLSDDQHIDLVGRVEDVAPYYHNAIMSVVPLLSGSGIRLKITESMSFGCPVVSTKLGAEGIAYNDSNIIISDSPDDFAAAVILLLNDNELRKKLSINGRILAEEKYDWKKLMHNFKELIYTL